MENHEAVVTQERTSENATFKRKSTGWTRSWALPDLPEVWFLHGRSLGNHFRSRQGSGAFKIGVAVRGLVEGAAGGEVLTVRRGQLVIVRPGDVHAGRARVPWWEKRILFAATDVVREALPRNIAGETLPWFDPVIDDHELASEFVRIHEGSEADPCSTRHSSEILRFVELLVERHAKSGERESGTQMCCPEVERAKELIESRFEDSIRIADLASEVGVDRFHLCRQFKRSLGLSPQEYLTQVRIDRAAELLLSGWPASDAAVEVGFCHQSHLGHHFKRVTGVSPVAYARELFEMGVVGPPFNTFLNQLNPLPGSPDRARP